MKITYFSLQAIFVILSLQIGSSPLPCISELFETVEAALPEAVCTECPPRTLLSAELTPIVSMLPATAEFVMSAPWSESIAGYGERHVHTVTVSIHQLTRTSQSGQRQAHCHHVTLLFYAQTQRQESGTTSLFSPRQLHTCSISPEGIDGSVIVEHALIGSGHGHGSAWGGVRQPILVDVRGVNGGGPKLRGSSDAAGGGSNARGELRKVVNRLKHGDLQKELHMSVRSFRLQACGGKLTKCPTCQTKVSFFEKQRTSTINCKPSECSLSATTHSKAKRRHWLSTAQPRAIIDRASEPIEWRLKILETFSTNRTFRRTYDTWLLKKKTSVCVPVFFNPC